MPKKRRGVPPLSNCSPRDVFKALGKLGGFEIIESNKHTKIKHVSTRLASTIPRHSVVNKHLLKDFIDEYLVGGLKYSYEEIYKHLWC